MVRLSRAVAQNVAAACASAWIAVAGLGPGCFAQPPGAPPGPGLQGVQGGPEAAQRPQPFNQGDRRGDRPGDQPGGRRFRNNPGDQDGVAGPQAFDSGNPQRREDMGEEPLPPEGQIRRGMGAGNGREFFTSATRSNMRRDFFEELKNVPTLERHLRPMMALQEERIKIQRERQRWASDPKGLEKFHSALGREDDLTSRQEELFRAFMNDLDTIRAEVEARREDIRKRYEEARKNDSPNQPMPSTDEARALYRNGKFYELFSDRLAALKDNPRPNEFMRVIMRGSLESNDMDPQMVERARKRIQELQQEQDDLRQRMKDLEDKLAEVQDILNISGRQGSRGPVREGAVRGAPPRERVPNPAPFPPNPPAGNDNFMPPPGAPGSFPGANSPPPQ
ncbi:MAG: hypothetical protein K1X53_02455 [Candidatus Sumerlaeaceae bacterium]|nr:hypothetical protein [Candidatus Sumerlaeaceae bacterium]